MKLKQMISAPTPQPINEELVQQVVEQIPEWTWDVVNQALITNIVDQMPSTVLERLTSDPQDTDRADEILGDYYKVFGTKEELIADAFHIIGEEATLFLLDALQLDKYQDPKLLETKS